MLRVALRPKFIGLLLLTLIVASVLAWLSQWQLARAFENATVEDHRTEQVMPLVDLQQPQQQTTDAAAGHLVSVRGVWSVGAPQLVAGRELDGVEGFWVVAPFRVLDDAGGQDSAGGQSDDGGRRLGAGEGALLSVALGWTESPADARDVADAWARSYVVDAVTGEAPLLELAGRYYPGEAPARQVGDALGAMAPAALVNLWPAPESARYSGYLVMDAPPPVDGAVGALTLIPTQPPPVDRSPSLQNLLYAVEWAVFCAGALYIWYRLVRDDYENELDEAEAAASTQAPAS